MTNCPDVGPSFLASALFATLLLPAAASTTAAQSAAPGEGGAPDAPAAPAPADGPAVQVARFEPEVKPASDAWKAAAEGHRPAAGLAVSLWAAEPLLANPVCFWPADDGSVYVVETFRCHHGVTDIREVMDWLDDDLAAQTVEDRLAMYRKWLGDGVRTYEEAPDRIRRLRDTDGDGLADDASVFADCFREAADGVAAGVIEHDGSVYFTDIPKLWALRDADGDGVAEDRRVLADGFGVRVAFLGHDLHGLRVGPDGRLWFSIGDRGFHVTTADGRLLHRPDTGAVFRCEPDGSDLAVVHIGLRNPQELVFDDWGELFTGDNNSDSGDQARVEQIVPGGDSGWRQPFQWLPDRGPWNREQLWVPDSDRHPAWLAPPIVNLTNGPSGFTHVPGPTLLGPAFDDRFLLCDFTGGADSSRVYAFELVPHGAGFDHVASDTLVQGILNTDVEIGPDGAAWVSDWVAGWSGTGEGRLWRVAPDPGAADATVPAGYVERAARTQRLLAAGTRDASVAELETRLGHFDRRVRQAAQFALAGRGVPGREALLRAARGLGSSVSAARENAWVATGAEAPAPRSGDGPASDRFAPAGSAARLALLARLHGLWGLLQAARHDPSGLDEVLGLAGDDEPEVRAQLLGWLPGPDSRWTVSRRQRAVEATRAGLVDPSPRVRLRAAAAAVTLGAVELVGDLVRAGVDPANRADPLLRKACAHALGVLADPAAWPPLADEESGSAAAQLRVLALREHLLWVDPASREASERLGRWVGALDLDLATEAARALYDVSQGNDAGGVPGAVPGAGLPALAERLASLPDEAPDPLLRRAVGACERLGRESDARALAAFAARDGAPVDLRRLALESLADWEHPPVRDRLNGFWRPPVERAAPFLADLARGLDPVALGATDASLERAWMRLAGATHDPGFVPALEATLADATRDGALRRSALEAIEALAPADWPEVLGRALEDADGSLRAAALDRLAALDPALALPRLPALLSDGEVAERRVAFGLLGQAGSPEADRMLLEQAAQLAAGRVPEEARLELVLAIEARVLVPPGQRPKTVSTEPPGPRPLRPDLDRDPALAALARDLAAHDAALGGRDDPLAPWLDSLVGGDRERGREVFERASLSCQRCHAREDEDALRVGPNLKGLGGRRGRRELVESIVLPNAQVVRGYAATRLFLAGGDVLAGRVLAEDDGTVTLLDADGREHVVPLAGVEERLPGLSPMPEGLADALDRRELRDLVEYLAGL